MSELSEALPLGLRRYALLSGYPRHPLDLDLLGRAIIVVGTYPMPSWGWRCLACLQGGRGDAATFSLALAVHDASCAGPSQVAEKRLALMTGLTAVCQDAGPAPWNTDVVSRILRTRAFWESLASQWGWPVGVFGIDGWDTNLQAAMNRATDKDKR